MAQTLGVKVEGPLFRDDVLITSAHVHEGISTPTRATVFAIASSELDEEGGVGGPALVSFTVDGDVVRRFHLVVVAVRCEGFFDGDRLRYVFELVHELELLSLRADVRMFQDKDAKEIVEEVLKGAGIDAGHLSFEVARTPGKRTYCVQYRETDLAFASRLLEHEGVFYVIEDDESSTHVKFADAQSAFSPIEGDTSVLLLHHAMHGAGIHDFTLESRAVPEQATVCDYNQDAPGVDLTNTKQGTGSPAGGVFEYATGHQKPAEGSALAAIRMEEIFAMRTIGRGKSDRMAFRAGAWFELDGASREALSTKYLLRSVEHRITPHATDAGEGLSYENAFTCMPHATPFRPPRVTPRPRLRGAHSVVVTGPAGAEIHTEKLGRMKGKFFWDRIGKDDDTSSCWMRLSQLPISGSMALARVGWEMTVVYLHGDPDRPMAVSRLYKADKVSPYAYPAAATRMALKTDSSPANGKSNEIRMEDGGGGMEMFINAAKDFDAVTSNNKTETVGVDETRKVGVAEEVTVGANETVSVGANRTTSVSSDAGLKVTGSRTKNVGGSETVSVGADLKTTVTGSDAETVGGSHTTLALMSVGRTSKGSHSLTVGGSMVSAAGLGVSVAVAGAKSETVGAAKISASASSVADSVVGAHAATVGGVRVQAAAGNRIGSAQGSSALTVGGLVVANAGKQLTLKGSTVSIRVLGVANLLGGGGVVNLTPGSAAFVGLVTLDASGAITVSGNPNLVG
ncbi:type VI secretion system tip protein TssI/VgrG [Sorangium sp. So ce119]|uniref:type VI secretion system Vgr family protein n=1 Tax=Sorangium sp. So ce119 TaxID=3133279 RepID=UPI003F5FC487